MKLFFSLTLIGVGLGVLIFTQRMTLAQDDPPEYEGSDECSTCHDDLYDAHEATAHALALFPARRNEERILADFDAGEATRTVTLEAGEEPRPFTLEDVAFVLGSGRHQQAFVYEMGSDEYRVLPAKWNTLTGAWESLGDSDAMKNWLADPRYDFAQQCVGCHVTGIEELDGSSVEWLDNGVQCEACHGAGENHVEIASDYGRNPSDEELLEIRASIVLSADAQICGQCHSQGIAAGGDHPFALDYRPGDDLLKHDLYSLVAQDDPAHWWSSGHASGMNMQFNEWLQGSSHDQALQAVLDSDAATDECLRCHSGDYRLTQLLITGQAEGILRGELYTLPTLDSAEQGITCTTCHTSHPGTEIAALTLADRPAEALEESETEESSAADEDDEAPLPASEEDDETATTADEESVADPEGDSTTHAYNLRQERYALCTDCHSDPDLSDGIHYPVQQMFEGAPVVTEVAAVPSAHFSSENGPDCVTCHMLQVPVGTSSRATHTMNIVAPGSHAANQIPIDSCTTCHAEQVSPAGMQALIDAVQGNTVQRLDAIHNVELSGAEQWVTQAVTFLDGDGSQGIHNYAYTNALLKALETELGIMEVAENSNSAAVDLLPADLREEMAANAATEAPLITITDADEDEPLYGLSITSLGIMVGSVLLIVFMGWLFFFRLRS